MSHCVLVSAVTMNSFWSYYRSPQAYKKDLHKKLSESYNRRKFFEDNKHSRALVEDLVEQSLGPIIQVTSLDYHIGEDGLTHYTSDYDLMLDEKPVGVFRRGFPFSITLHFNRKYNPDEDFFHLLAEYGPTPSLGHGTKYKIPVTSKELEDRDALAWHVWSVEEGDTNIKLQIQTPCNCQVGIWKLSIFSYKENTPGFSRFTFKDEIFVLFNPWNKMDDVYLESELERDEYVLSDVGKIWMGTNKAPIGYPWVFGQYDVVVLPALAVLLENADVPHSNRGSPVHISRALTAIVNHYDDEGLLEGKWKGEFKDGTMPVSWTGSVAFFDEFLQSGKPVKYAQCWIFAGAVTTACRALGIPCRPVTCFVCAHDTNNSLTVDKFFTKDGKVIEGGEDDDCYDSTWNFHCWNDVWMARPDLPPGYGGWQAIDGTPQEESGNTFRTGPASIRAVKEGNIGFLYDTSFLFSEVNADFCHFMEDSNSHWGFTRIKLDTAHIGRRIVTRGLIDDSHGERAMEDITSLYKNTEGTEAEREAVFNAIRGHPKAQKYYKSVDSSVVRDVFFKLKDVDTVFAGEPFVMVLTVENHSTRPRTVTTVLSARSVLYTGTVLNTIKEGKVNVTLTPKQVKSIRVNVMPEEYRSPTGSHTHIKVTAVAVVTETGEIFSAEDDFEVINRKLEIKMPDPLMLGSVFEVQFSFTNPLAEPLTNCELIIEGPGLQRPKVIKLSNVPPNGQVKHSESLLPKRLGPRVLVATFNSNQLSRVKGSKKVMVQK